MDDYEKEAIIVSLAVIIGTIAIIFLIMFISYLFTSNITEANTINAYVGDDLVFSGKKAFVDIQSSGDTTTLIIYSKLFPFRVMKNVYTGRNILVK